MGLLLCRSFTRGRGNREHDDDDDGASRRNYTDDNSNLREDHAHADHHPRRIVHMMIIGQWGIIRILRGKIDRMMMRIACALMLPLSIFWGHQRSCSSHLIAAATAVNAATAVAAAAAVAQKTAIAAATAVAAIAAVAVLIAISSRHEAFFIPSSQGDVCR